MKFAIVGCGVIAALHAETLKSIPDATIYAACDIILDKAEAFAKKWDIPVVYQDYHEVMDDPEVDIVCVCVPSGTHGEVCIAAANAGKAIFCEKPMEITPERIDDIIKAVDETGVTMQCVFQRRLMPIAQATKKVIDEGYLGRICTAHADLKYYRDQAYYDSAGWRGTWDEDGGGALMNQGVHGIDLILWMVGGKVKTVYGRAETLARDIDVEDTAAAIVQMDHGGLVTIDGATTCYPGSKTTFEIHGEKGSIVFNDEGLELWSFINEESAPPKPEAGEAVMGLSHTDLSASGHYQLIVDLMKAVKKKSQNVMIPPREARTAVQVICAIYESSKTGDVIHFD